MPVKVLSGLLALLFVVAGIPKVIGVESVVTEFTHMGYGAGFRVLIGVLEIAGGLALLVPGLALVGAGVLIVIMIGATWTLVSLGQPPIPPIVVGLLLGVLVWLRTRSAAA